MVSTVLMRRPRNSSGSAICSARGIFNPILRECRCTAGWSGRWCTRRMLRRCNSARDGSILMRESLCAGDCDDERGICYCAQTSSVGRWQRPLPHQCQPRAHRLTRLPDGRPAYPVRAGAHWEMANMVFERNGKDRGWARADQTHFEWLYGTVGSNPLSAPRGGRKVTPFCTSPGLSPRHLTGCRGGGCPVGRTGQYCEQPARSFCLRDCSGHGRCDGGFCWCRATALLSTQPIPAHPSPSQPTPTHPKPIPNTSKHIRLSRSDCVPSPRFLTIV